MGLKKRELKRSTFKVESTEWMHALKEKGTFHTVQYSFIKRKYQQDKERHTHICLL
jgi:hypothetical protein